jgi:hypothetical protein
MVFWSPLLLLLAVNSNIQLVDRETGAPIPQATVTISAENGSWQVETGSTGTAALPALKPGAYRVKIEISGYIDPADAENQGRNFQLPGRILVALTRASALEGQVTNPAGQPLSGMGVFAVRRAGLRPQSVGSPAMTDDAGRYRLHHLPPGVYSVAALPAEEPHGAVYYPGQRDAARAEWVTLGPGAERRSLDIRVAAGAPGSLAGSVTGVPAAWPASRAAILVMSRAGIQLPVATTATGEAGQFQLEALPAGEYAVLACGPMTSPDYSTAPDAATTRYAAGTVTIRENEPARLDLKLAPGLRVEARLAGAPGLRLRAAGDWPEIWQFAPRRDAGSLVWENLPPGAFQFDIPDLEPGRTFAGVRPAGSRDEPLKTVTITSTAVLEAVLETENGEISGQWLNGGQSLGLWAENDATLGAQCETGADGAFRFAHLLAGRYRLWQLAPVARLLKEIVLERGQQMHLKLDQEK